MAYNGLAMRSCENAVRLDPTRSGAISLWLSSFFRLEAEGFEQPVYFGERHAKAGTYALTAGPEFLHRVVVRALRNRNRPVAMAAIIAAGLDPATTPVQTIIDAGIRLDNSIHCDAFERIAV